ncbi:MAG: CRISPR-associated protein Cas4, partial [Nitrososphaerota archaeon]
MDRVLRQLKSMYGSIDESLRGWNWSNDVLSPPLEGVYLGVSELANRYCSTYRDVYLKRVLSKPAPFSYK